MISMHERLLQEIEQEKFELTWTLIGKRVGGCFLTLIIGIVNCLCIYLLIGNTEYIRSKALEGGGVAAAAAEYIVPAGVSFLSAVTPMFIIALSEFESWTSQMRFVMTFMRVFLLRLVSVMATLWMAFYNDEIVESDCPIDAMGRVLIQLINFDTVSEFVWCVIIPPILMAYLRWDDRKKQQQMLLQASEDDNELSDKGLESSSFDPQFRGEQLKSHFDIEANIVDLMYRQTIIWTSMPFSPMSTAIASLSFVISFFSKKFWIVGYCHRPKRALGVDKQFRWFYGMLILSWCIALTIFLNFTNTAVGCSTGPYVSPEVPRTVLNDYYEKAPETLTSIVEWAQTLVWFAMFFMGIWLFYIQQRKQVFQRDAKQLKQMLQMEKDEKLAIIRDYRVTLRDFD